MYHLAFYLKLHFLLFEFRIYYISYDTKNIDYIKAINKDMLSLTLTHSLQFVDSQELQYAYGLDMTSLSVYTHYSSNSPPCICTQFCSATHSIYKCILYTISLALGTFINHKMYEVISYFFYIFFSYACVWRGAKCV